MKSSEISHFDGEITLPEAGSTQRFPIEHGGKQGNAETPDEFKALIEFIMGPIVLTWERRQFSLKLDGWETSLTHPVWADNIWLYATSMEQMMVMTQDLTDAIYAYERKWKVESLELLTPTGLEGANSVCGLRREICLLTRGWSSWMFWAHVLIIEAPQAPRSTIDWVKGKQTSRSTPRYSWDLGASSLNYVLG